MSIPNFIIIITDETAHFSALCRSESVVINDLCKAQALFVGIMSN